MSADTVTELAAHRARLHWKQLSQDTEACFPLVKLTVTSLMIEAWRRGRDISEDQAHMVLAMADGSLVRADLIYRFGECMRRGG